MLEWAVLSLALPLRIALALGTDLSPDEAYYLSAARLGVRIVDHPPLLVWLLRQSDRLPGPVELRVRCWPLMLSLATSLGCVELARRRGAGPDAVRLTAVAALWALLPMAGGFVATPDTLLLAAFVGALLLLEPSPRRPPSALDHGLAGFAMGLACLAKVVALPLSLGVGLRSRGLGRRVIPLIGALLAVPLALPSLRFQLHHAFGHSQSNWSALGALGAVLAAVSAQAFLWSPGVVWLGVQALPTAPASDRALVLGLSALVLVSALVRGVPPEPNWWAPAGLVLLVGFALACRNMRRGQRALILATAVIPTMITSAHTIWPFLPLPASADPTARLHGWSSGHEPRDAAGMGAYALAAERCVYRNRCDELISDFNQLRIHE